MALLGVWLPDERLFNIRPLPRPSFILLPVSPIPIAAAPLVVVVARPTIDTATCTLDG